MSWPPCLRRPKPTKVSHQRCLQSSGQQVRRNFTCARTARVCERRRSCSDSPLAQFAAMRRQCTKPRGSPTERPPRGRLSICTPIQAGHFHSNTIEHTTQLTYTQTGNIACAQLHMYVCICHRSVWFGGAWAASDIVGVPSCPPELRPHTPGYICVYPLGSRGGFTAGGRIGCGHITRDVHQSRGHVALRTCTFTRKYTHTYICMHAHTMTRTHHPTHTYTHMYICIHTYIHTYIHAYMHVCRHTYICT